ncbi:hypothetical protein [Embleya sp. AB8]|uniref:WXG100-like domain-containing protein n=1 Tax=Embleya sp. AB8 TaxID=3156304 RepID=UPI003C72907B
MDKAGQAVDFVVDLAEAGLDECMKVLKGLVTLGDDAVEQVIRFLGLPWPKADEDKLRQMAGSYERMAATLDQVSAGAAGPARAIIANNSGLPIDNFATFWNRYEGGGQSWLPATAASCRDQATSLRKLADAVQTQKTVLKAEILAVAATILVGAGLLIVPGVNIISGAAMSAATAAAESAATACGLAISATVLEIIGSIAGSAVIGAVTSVVLDLAVAQPIKIAMGAQDGLKTDHLLETAAYGGAGGAVAGGMSAGAQQLPKLALPTRLNALTTLTAKAPTLLNSIPGQVVAGGGTAAMIDAATGRPVTLLDVLAGSAGGAAGGGAARVGPRGRPSITDTLAGTTPENRGEGNFWTADLSNVTGKTTQARNRAIEIAIREDFPDLKFTHTAQYSPWVNTGIAKPNHGTQIGFKSFESRLELRKTLVHEELHHRWFGQGNFTSHHPRDGSGTSDKFYEIVNRYLRMRGWLE